VRNYDLDAALPEGYLLMSAWLGRRVIGMVEGMAGLADGMNEAGLAVSLAFGGRPVVGRGFGVPLIVRYLLEVCADVQDAIDALRGLPCHMSYNLTMVDAAGRGATVMLAPDRPPIVAGAALATNHQLGAEWPRHARLSRTLERAELLADALADPATDGDVLEQRFLAPPLHSRRYAEGFGTIYTAAYRPVRGAMRLSWPGLSPWRQSFQGFKADTRRLTFADGRAPREMPPAPDFPRDGLLARAH
jgi:predicted choloylglycine hydrolase